jgi:hypothetical protein
MSARDHVNYAADSHASYADATFPDASDESDATG